MTANTENFRPLHMREFDRDAEFRATARLPLANGKRYRPGDIVDTSAFNTRRLRQLYQQRFITMHEPEETRDDAARPHFEQMPTPAVVSWLKTRRKVPRAGSKRMFIVLMADAVWRKEHGLPAPQPSSE